MERTVVMIVTVKVPKRW